MDMFLEDLRLVFYSLGLKKGDIVYVASNITLLLNTARKKYNVKTDAERNIFLNNLIDSLQKIVSEEGTILFPMYTWGFCRKKTFDRQVTKCEVGILNNWVMDKRRDFIRTRHPIYSFMVWGKDAKYLESLENKDSWGKGSPFEYLHIKKAKMLMLDVHLKQCFTFMHYVEQCINVPFRYLKKFRSHYIDDGSDTERSYTMFVRDLDIDSEIYEPDSMLIDPGVMKEKYCEGVGIRLVELFDAYDVYKNDFIYNAGRKCYKFKNYVLNWNTPQTHPDDLYN